MLINKESEEEYVLSGLEDSRQAIVDLVKEDKEKRRKEILGILDEEGDVLYTSPLPGDVNYERWKSGLVESKK